MSSQLSMALTVQDFDFICVTLSVPVTSMSRKQVNDSILYFMYVKTAVLSFRIKNNKENNSK